MFKRILVGSVAGALATVPMSGVVWGFRRAGLYRGKPAPEVISEETTDRAVGLHRVPEPLLKAIKFAQHFGFGSAIGSAYGAVSPLMRPRYPAGVLTGLGVWKASYDGWIPGVKILPPPRHDEQGRMLTMVTAHVVYGLTLAAIMDRWFAWRK